MSRAWCDYCAVEWGPSSPQHPSAGLGVECQGQPIALPPDGQSWLDYYNARYGRFGDFAGFRFADVRGSLG